MRNFWRVTIVVAAFLFASTVLAQEEGSAEAPVVVEPTPPPPSPEPSPVAEPVVESVPEPVAEPVEAPVQESVPVETIQTEPAAPSESVSETQEESEQSAEAQATEEAIEVDNTIEAEDLGVSESRILPDSPLYGFKRFGRKIHEAITFDPVKKAEVRLQNASQELADAEQLLEEAPEDLEAVEAVASSVEAYTETVAGIREDVADIAEESAGGNGGTEELLDNVLDKQIKHQKIFNKIENHILQGAEENIPEGVLEKIRQAKEESHGTAGEMMVAIEEDPTALAGRMDQVLARQAGSQFKDLRNLEVLKSLEDFVPEEAKEAIRQAQDNAFKRFSAQLENIDPKTRWRLRPMCVGLAAMKPARWKF